jgi:hypothetical protein
MTFTLTREQLYDLVWSEPMQPLAKQIGISDVAIAKHCRKLGVPVPKRGYWNKLQAGKPVTKPELLMAMLRPRSGSGPSPRRTFRVKSIEWMGPQRFIRPSRRTRM